MEVLEVPGIVPSENRSNNDLELELAVIASEIDMMNHNPNSLNAAAASAPAVEAIEEEEKEDIQGFESHDIENRNQLQVSDHDNQPSSLVQAMAQQSAILEENKNADENEIDLEI